MPHYLILRVPIAAGATPVLCQDTWRDGCRELATWQVNCGPDVWFFCVSHEGPPCGGVFGGDFVITPDTTRDELMAVVERGSHRIHSAAGRDVHELRCCACGVWIGDALDSDIRHVSEPLNAECRPGNPVDTNEPSCSDCQRK